MSRAFFVVLSTRPTLLPPCVDDSQTHLAKFAGQEDTLRMLVEAGASTAEHARTNQYMTKAAMGAIGAVF